MAATTNAGIATAAATATHATPALVLAGALGVVAAATAVPTTTPFAGALVSQAATIGITGASLGLLASKKIPVPWWAWGTLGVLGTNYFARLMFLAGTGADEAANETAAVSRWDATSTSVAFLAAATTAYYAARVAWAPPGSGAQTRSGKAAYHFFHWGTFLATIVVLYPLMTLLPLLRGVPPGGYDAPLSQLLMGNCDGVTYYR